MSLRQLFVSLEKKGSEMVLFSASPDFVISLFVVESSKHPRFRSGNLRDMRLIDGSEPE